MEIREDISELQSLTMELKRVKERAKELRQLKMDVEKRILDYLEENDQPGVNYKDVVLLAQNKEGFKRGKAKEKILRGAEYLEQRGIQNGKQIVSELLDAIKGSPVSKSQLKMMKRKKKAV